MLSNLTVIILVKNEEKNIRKSINFAKKIAKRIIVIDSYSDDKTKDICIELGVDFYEHKFTTFSEKLNWGLYNTKIDTDWIMRLDADEELTKELIKEINTRLDTLSNDINGIMLNRRIYFMGRWIKHGGIYPMKVLRIFRNGTAYCEEKIVDEHMILKTGRSIEFKYDFIDNDIKSLFFWISKHNTYSSKAVTDYFDIINKNIHRDVISPKLIGQQFQRKRWIKNNIYYRLPIFFRAKLYFFYRYYIRLGFLDGKEGKIYHFLQAYWYRFLIDSKIYENEKIVKGENKCKL